jgi:hypothetical protein
MGLDSDSNSLRLPFNMQQNIINEDLKRENLEPTNQISFKMLPASGMQVSGGAK